MSASVVDTNVAVVANGRDTHASIACRRACIEFLIALRDDGQTVIDSRGGILAEYYKRLRPEGQPGVGDLFYRHVLDNQGTPRAVISVSTDIDRTLPLKQAFVAGTLSQFDEDDRVFALTSASARKPVATAIDTDWPTHEVGLKSCGVIVKFVCGRPTAERGGVEPDILA